MKFWNRIKKLPRETKVAFALGFSAGAACCLLIYLVFEMTGLNNYGFYWLK